MLVVRALEFDSGQRGRIALDLMAGEGRVGGRWTSESPGSPRRSRVLRGVGLVRLVETRVRGRAREAVYDLAGHDMTIDYDLADRSKREAIGALIRGMSRIASRDFERASGHGRAVVKGPRRNLRGARMVGLLDGHQIEELNRLYERIAEIMATRPRERAEAEFHAVTHLISPLDRRHRAVAEDA